MVKQINKGNFNDHIMRGAYGSKLVVAWRQCCNPFKAACVASMFQSWFSLELVSWGWTAATTHYCYCLLCARFTQLLNFYGKKSARACTFFIIATDKVQKTRGAQKLMHRQILPWDILEKHQLLKFYYNWLMSWIIQIVVMSSLFCILFRQKAGVT